MLQAIVRPAPVSRHLYAFLFQSAALENEKMSGLKLFTNWAKAAVWKNWRKHQATAGTDFDNASSHFQLSY